MRGTRIPRLFGFWNYLNNYYVMYKRLTRSRIRVELASPLLGVRNYLNNYFANYTRMTRSGIRMKFRSPAYLELGNS